ncbi:MAG: ADP-heptose synthase, partial [Verrucomicrobia bacterium]|nr:ADP-heptose synthase [Verrucomicrobiota bacterium]
MQHHDVIEEILSLANGRVVVFVSGNFNILHPGHLRLLQFAKECGEFLVVGVYSNRIATVSAMLDEALRIEAVQSNSWVDYAFLLDTPVEDLIAALKPGVVVKGKEHENRWN